MYDLQEVKEIHALVGYYIMHAGSGKDLGVKMQKAEGLMTPLSSKLDLDGQA